MSPIITVKAFKCTRCGYVWLSRKFLQDNMSIPIACSSCKSPYWNIEKKKKENKKEKKK